MAEVMIRPLLEQVVAELVFLPNHKNITFQYRINDRASWKADPVLVRIVLRCLLSNAIVFRPGNVRGVVEITSLRKDSLFCLDVSDDGEGIPREVGGRIFEMFFRGSPRSSGPGLGLYTARRIMHRLGGKLTFSGVPGRTTFTMALPENPLAAS